MSLRNQIVLFVEGDGDREAAPVLLKRKLTELNAWGRIDRDTAPMTVRSLNGLIANKCARIRRYLKLAANRPRCGGVLILLDGDSEQFCAASSKSSLDAVAREAVGEAFPVQACFAIPEYESWLLAGIESLRGVQLLRGNKVRDDASAPSGDGPRDAKRALAERMTGTYKPTLDQSELTEHVDFRQIRERSRSFRRFDHAVEQLVAAIGNRS